MTQSEIEMEKLKNADKIAKRHEDREDVRNKRSSYTKLGGDLSKGAIGAIASMINSPDWYKQYDGQEGINTTIPDYFVGDQRDTRYRSVGTGANDVISSVFQVRYYQTIGMGRVPNSATVINTVNYGAVGQINTAVSRIRAQLGKRNSIAFTLSKDTFARYLVAVIDSLFVPMKRMKTAIDWFTVANAYYPQLADKVLVAMGFVPNDFAANIANNRDQYNKYANMINASIPMVKSNTFLQRRLFMCGLTLKDRDDVRAQHVVFCPMNEAYVSSSDDIIRYRYIQNQSSKEFWDNLLHTFNNIIDGATWKQVIRLFLNGFDEAELYKMPVNPDVVSSSVGYSSEMLNQLHNMTTCPSHHDAVQGYDGSSMYIGQWVGDSFSLGGDANENIIQGCIVEHPTLATTLVGAIIPRFGPVKLVRGSSNLTTQGGSVLPVVGRGVLQETTFNTFTKAKGDDFLVGTRLTDVYAFLGSAAIVQNADLGLRGFSGTSTASQYYGAFFPVSYSTEIVDSIVCITTDLIPTSARNEDYATVTGEDEGRWNFSYTDDLYNDTEYRSAYMVTSVADINKHFAEYTQIDWLPLTKIWSALNGYSTYGEIASFTSLPEDALNKLHGQAILSEFSIQSKVFLPPLK